MKVFSRSNPVMLAMCLGFIISPSLHAQASVVNPHEKRGPEVAAAVRKRIAADAHLRKALDRVEGRGLHPNVELAVMLTGNGLRSTAGDQRPAAVFATGLVPRPNEVISGDAVELTFIPAYTSPGYWEGTVAAQRYDAQGSLLDENISNIVMSSPDPSTAFDVTYEDAVYVFTREDPAPYTLSALGDDPDHESTARKPRLQPALTGAEHGHAPVATIWRGGWGAWGKCSGAWCGGAAVGCALGNWWNAEIAWGPCTAMGCVAGAIGCTYGTLWN